MSIWEIPEVDGVEKDKTHEYQGIGIRNLEAAVYQGWVPVKAEEKVGTNWPEGPNGFRMYQEQVLCKMTKARWDELQRGIDENRRALSIEAVEEKYRNEMGEAAAVADGSIRDG